MVVDVDKADNDDGDMALLDDVFMATGTGIGDPGATKPLMGTEVWNKWKDRLVELGKDHQIVTEKCDRRFRFGNNQVLDAKTAVTFRV